MRKIKFTIIEDIVSKGITSLIALIFIMFYWILPVTFPVVGDVTISLSNDRLYTGKTATYTITLNQYRTCDAREIRVFEVYQTHNRETLVQRITVRPSVYSIGGRSGKSTIAVGFTVPESLSPGPGFMQLRFRYECWGIKFLDEVFPQVYESNKLPVFFLKPLD